MMMNTHHLELFYHVAKAGGITPALHSIPYGIQQPAVSAQMARLEETLEIKLFHRRPFALTPRGEVLYQYIRPFFEGLPQLELRLRGGVESLRIGAKASILRDYLPEALEQFMVREKGVELELREADQPEAEILLRDQKIDLALCELSQPLPGHLRQAVLIQVEPVLLVPESGEWTRASEFLKEGSPLPPLITFEEREVAVRLFRKYLQQRNLHWPTRLQVGSADLVKIYCSRGFGVGLMARVRGEKAPDGFRYLPLRGIERFPVGVLWQPGLTSVPERFLEFIRTFR